LILRGFFKIFLIISDHDGNGDAEDMEADMGQFDDADPEH